MSSEIRDCDKNEEEHFREIIKDRTEIISTELETLTSDSKTSSKKIKNLHLTVDNLKSEIQTVTEKIERIVDLFRSKLSNKITLILNLLGEKNINAQSTKDCYKIVSSLAEILSAVGYELDKNVSVVSTKVNFFDMQVKNISENSLLKIDNSTVWFIDGEGRLTKRNNTRLDSSLPLFKSDKRNREKFISRISNIFSYYEVPRCLWVGLAVKQLIGKYQRWWNSTNDYKNISWTEFSNMFVAAKFNNKDIVKNYFYIGDKNTIQKLLSIKINGSNVDHNISEINSFKFLKNRSKSWDNIRVNSSNYLYSEKSINVRNDPCMKLKAMKRKRNENENENLIEENNYLDEKKKSCTDNDTNKSNLYF